MVRLLLIELWKYQDCSRLATTKNCYNVFFYLTVSLLLSKWNIKFFLVRHYIS